MKVKSYQELLDEATLKNNPGIPGSGDDSDDSEDYLAKIETRARERLEALSRRHGQDIPRFMSLVAKARSIQAGHEKELEKLAEESIRSLYGRAAQIQISLKRTVRTKVMSIQCLITILAVRFFRCLALS